MVEVLPLSGVFAPLPRSSASLHSFEIVLPSLQHLGVTSSQAASTHTRSLSDTELLRRIAIDRCEVAFGELYDRFARDVYGLFRRALKSEQDAQDLLQEVFIQIWNKVPEFYDVCRDPKSWILTVARNRMLDEVRSKRYRNRQSEQTLGAHEEHPELGTLVETSSTPDAYMTSMEAQFEIRRALKKLTSDQRELVDLAYFSGLSYSEIANKQGIPLSTVKTRMRQTVKKLRGVVQPRMEFVYA